MREQNTLNFLYNIFAHMIEIHIIRKIITLLSVEASTQDMGINVQRLIQLECDE